MRAAIATGDPQQIALAAHKVMEAEDQRVLEIVAESEKKRAELRSVANILIARADKVLREQRK